MCGIAGILSNSPSEGSLRSMLTAMKHRGPDDRGVWIKEGMHLGHNRLSIIDLSPAGHQPMLSVSGRYILVYNGEVYNFQTLRKELISQGVSFRSHTDTEVILALWEREGTACISRLRGMFAFAIWDQFEKTLTLVRDRLGIKPLYYAQTPQGFVFASEIKGMLASGLVAKEINAVAVALILQKGYVQQPHTILQNVHALMPGQLLRLQGQTISTEVYWKLENKGTPYHSEQEAIEAIRTQVIESVHEEMISDRSVGVFLSGGLDSTILVAALRAAGHNDIKSFTVGFDSSDQRLNEDSDAKSTAIFYETDHHHLHVDAHKISTSFESFIDDLDQPSIDGLNTWLVSSETSKYVTVALSGLGGDELFSGYSIDRNILYWHQQNNWILKALKFSSPFWNNNLFPDTMRYRFTEKSKLADFIEGYMEWGRVDSAENAGWLSETTTGFQHNTVYNLFKSIDINNHRDLLQRITNMHLYTFMSSRVLRDSDAVSMCHSMEVRFPLIDHKLVELAYHLPQNWRIKSVRKAAQMKNFEKENSYEKTRVKHLLYQAFKNELPQGFGERAKKGFKLPMSEWLHKGLDRQLEPLFYNNNALLSQKALQQEWEQWKNGKTGWGKIWNLAVLESWHARLRNS